MGGGGMFFILGPVLSSFEPVGRSVAAGLLVDLSLLAGETDRKRALVVERGRAGDFSLRRFACFLDLLFFFLRCLSISGTSSSSEAGVEDEDDDDDGERRLFFFRDFWVETSGGGLPATGDDTSCPISDSPSDSSTPLCCRTHSVSESSPLAVV